MVCGVYVWHLVCMRMCVCAYYLVCVYVCDIWCVCVAFGVCVRLMCVYVCIMYVCMYVCMYVFFRDCHLSFIFEKTKSINNDSIITTYVVKTVRLYISVTVSYR